MVTWRNHMPRGMLLKSDGFASSLSAPADGFTLADYCARCAIPYDDMAIPVSLQTFVDYACNFQERFVPTVDRRTVIGLRALPEGFELRVENDTVIVARKVVLAVGIAHFAKMPDELADLPHELASHSSAHNDLDRFLNRDVTVVGGGSSAIDLSALLHEAGAKVRLVVRNSVIRFGTPPETGGKSWWHKTRHPQSGLWTGYTI